MRRRTIQKHNDNLAPFTAGVTAGNTPPQATEGTVGTPITPTQASINVTLGQYADQMVGFKFRYIV